MSIRFCPACGAEVNAQSNFCPTCGGKIPKDTEETIAVEPILNEPMLDSVEKINMDFECVDEPSKPKTSKRKWLLLGVAWIAMVVIAVLFNGVVPIIGLVALFASPVFFVIFIVQVFRRKDKKKWALAWGVSVLTLFAMLFISTSVCDHNWIDATCEAPKTCASCGETEGNPIAHDWVDATCDTPKVCTSCGETEGNPIAHDWATATCSIPETCLLCGDTRGDTLEHAAGDWKTSSTDMVAATVTSKKYCNVCGDEVDRKTVSLKQLHDGTHFLMSPKQFVERLEGQLDELSGNTLETMYGEVDGDFACGITDDGEKVGAFLFTEGDGAITTEQRNDVCFNKLLGTVDGQRNVARVLLALIETCDPAIDFDDAKELASDAIYLGSVTENGVTYVVMITDDNAIIGVTLEE